MGQWRWYLAYIWNWKDWQSLAYHQHIYDMHTIWHVYQHRKHARWDIWCMGNIILKSLAYLCNWKDSPSLEYLWNWKYWKSLANLCNWKDLTLLTRFSSLSSSREELPASPPTPTLTHRWGPYMHISQNRWPIYAYLKIAENLIILITKDDILGQKSNASVPLWLYVPLLRPVELLEIKARGRFGAVWKGQVGLPTYCLNLLYNLII